MISHLGRYEVIGELGQGAMGIVYRAKDPLIDRVVAIKTISLGFAQEGKDEYEQRFYQEAKAAGRLSHPNIVTIYDVGKSGDVAYIAMEFLHGRELRDIMNSEGLLAVDQVLDIVAQVASGLAYAHEHDIVHRDVKPSNIMVIRDGHIKITDFGIARMASAGVHTQTGMVLGSPKYMSPEQVMGKTIDQRSDIFSLGVMLYEMLTGIAPFNGENVNAIMYQTLNAVPPPPNSVNAKVPEMMNFIVAKALAKGLDDRYFDARDFATDLRACRDTMPRSGNQLDVAPPAGGERKPPEVVSVSGSSGHWRADQEEAKTASVTGLSVVFDSMAATMRLAALTATSADVDELSKTFSMPRPSAEEIKMAAPKPANQLLISPILRPATLPQPPDPPANSRGNFILIVVVVLILLLAIAILVH